MVLECSHLVRVRSFLGLGEGEIRLSSGEMEMPRYLKSFVLISLYLSQSSPV